MCTAVAQRFQPRLFVHKLHVVWFVQPRVSVQQLHNAQCVHPRAFEQQLHCVHCVQPRACVQQLHSAQFMRPSCVQALQTVQLHCLYSEHTEWTVALCTMCIVSGLHSVHPLPPDPSLTLGNRSTLFICSFIPVIVQFYLSTTTILSLVLVQFSLIITAALLYFDLVQLKFQFTTSNLLS